MQTGGYASPEQFNDGLVPAAFVGAAVVALGSLVALLVPGKRRREVVELAPSLDAAA